MRSDISSKISTVFGQELDLTGKIPPAMINKNSKKRKMHYFPRTPDFYTFLFGKMLHVFSLCRLPCIV